MIRSAKVAELQSSKDANFYSLKWFRKMSMYRNLKVWEKAMVLVTSVYKSTQKFPDEERYGLTSQMRRSSVSIPSNIAEGYGRKGKKDYVRFLSIAIGSLFELQTQTEIAKNLNFLSSSNFEKLYEDTREVERMLSSYIRKIEKSS